MPTFVDSIAASREIPDVGWHAAVPAGTAEGDLLIHGVTTGGAIYSIDSPGWTLLAFYEAIGLWVFGRRADAGDAGGNSGAFFNARDIGGFSAFVGETYITTAWRDAPDYTEGTSDGETTATTSHNVPAVVTPGADTLIIVYAAMDISSNEDELAIPTFTRNVYYGGSFLGGFSSTQFVMAVFSRGAGLAGSHLMGPWTMETYDASRMAFVVLGLIPRVPPRGAVTLPYYIPLGNAPPPVG